MFLAHASRNFFWDTFAVEFHLLVFFRLHVDDNPPSPRLSWSWWLFLQGSSRYFCENQFGMEVPTIWILFSFSYFQSFPWSYGADEPEKYPPFTKIFVSHNYHFWVKIVFNFLLFLRIVSLYHICCLLDCWQKYYFLLGLLLTVFLIYIGISDGLSGGEVLDFAVIMGNLWGITVSILLLGYGLVELPRSFWKNGEHVVALNHVYFKAVQVWEETEQSKEELYQTWQLLNHVRKNLEGKQSPLLVVLGSVEAKCPIQVSWTMISSIVCSPA